MVRRYRAWAGLALLTAGAAVLPFLLEHLSVPSLPGTLGRLRLVSIVDGEEARAVVDRMHGKRVAQRGNWIGLYSGQGGSATVYLTRYASAAAATSDGNVMGDRIASGEGGGVFGHFRRTAINSQPVSVCMGLGQIHFFFARGRCLYWLAVDPPVAESALKALLNPAD
jgi:hypothetical protein